MKSVHDGRRSDDAPRPITLPAISHIEAIIKCVGPALFPVEKFNGIN
jgi:hypothetical protein